jgi:hypothetical protein
MRGRRVISIVLLFSAILMVSGVFASGFVTVPVSLNNILSPTGGAGLLTTASVSVDPAYYFKDYTLQPVGSKFWVHVNVAGASDLFTWQFNITWNKALLNVSRILTADNATYILSTTTSVNKTSTYQLGFVINATDNAKGNAGAAETILDNRVAPTGVSGSGRLVSIQFKVVGYGSCDLIISTTGNLQTTLLDSTGATITITSATNGYFSNKAIGDINGDRSVDGLDFGIFAKKFGSSVGSPNYDREADLNKDTNIDGLDFGLFAKNFGRSV